LTLTIVHLGAKVNQNVSVDVIEDGFGETLLRVISLQDHGTPGLMQVATARSTVFRVHVYAVESASWGRSAGCTPTTDCRTNG
jgi:hypothetical protein